jgi:hypothetical protein
MFIQRRKSVRHPAIVPAHTARGLRQKYRSWGVPRGTGAYFRFRAKLSSNRWAVLFGGRGEKISGN